MMEICFATNNAKKLAEIQAAIGEEILIRSLEDIDCIEELPETQETIEGNSLQKATYVHEHYKINCFADDTGLEVEALGGAPGVYSGRYAGEPRSDENNIDLLLKNLSPHRNRKARFKTVITLIINGQVKTFTGIVEGQILKGRTGVGGFGYDPIFQPLGYDISFAQMSMSEKNKISHRGIAVQQLIKYLKGL